MAKAPAEMMREFVKSQNFTSTDEAMTAMKEMFKDILQVVMECELSEELGYIRTMFALTAISRRGRAALRAEIRNAYPHLSAG